MSLKKYSELSEAEKKLVYVMFSDQTTVEQYLYNFDNGGSFRGRQYAPPSGIIHAESTVPDLVVEEEKPKARRPKKK